MSIKRLNLQKETFFSLSNDAIQVVGGTAQTTGTSVRKVCIEDPDTSSPCGVTNNCPSAVCPTLGCPTQTCFGFTCAQGACDSDNRICIAPA
jgi:hypothetical protein